MTWSKRTFAVALAVFVGCSVLSAPAFALYKYSTKAPVWKVGKYNERLSKACRYSRFTVDATRMIIKYQGKKGYGGTRVGLKGWNLYDPGGLAERGKAYHFWHSGYSDCKVYVEVLR